jgi:hypothetical protein
MPAGAGLSLGEDDVAVRVETVPSSQSGDAGANDGNPHLHRTPPRSPQLLPTRTIITSRTVPATGVAATKESR